MYLNWISRQFKKFGEGSKVQKISNLSNPQCISIGTNVYIGNCSVLDAIVNHKEQRFNPEIIIGDNTSLGDYCHLGAINFIHIGKDVLAGRFVLITDHSHGSVDERFSEVPPFSRSLFSKGGVTIGDRVWIGDKATILSGVTIGEGSIIGANSVVTEDVPPHSVVAGSPARVISKS
jgi:acetyltransferase-like isoleucine patch superfamily enzyme